MPTGDLSDDDEFDETVALVWRAANATDLSPGGRKDLQRLIRELREARGELADLIADKERFGASMRSALGSRLIPGLVSLSRVVGRPLTPEDIQAYLHEALAEAQAVREEPLKAMTPTMSSRPLELAELPDIVYLALGRLVVRFGQLEESVNMILHYLSKELGQSAGDPFTDDLNVKRERLNRLAPDALKRGLMTKVLLKGLKQHLDSTTNLARQRRRFIHAGYMLPKDSPSEVGWIRRGDKRRPGIISLEELNVDEIEDLTRRTKVAAEEGWSLFHAILDNNRIGPASTNTRKDASRRR